MNGSFQVSRDLVFVILLGTGTNVSVVAESW